MARVARVLPDPAPGVLVTRFGPSSIELTVSFWHGSDVASEFETRHDVLLAIHQGLSLAGIAIAVPQVMMWSAGAPQGESPYDSHPDEVFTRFRPPTAPPEEPAPRRLLAWRRGSASD